jgi:hypothetical protein
MHENDLGNITDETSEKYWIMQVDASNSFDVHWCDKSESHQNGGRM